MTTLEILKRAREIISKPENWTKGAYYSCRDGNTHHCLVGAIQVAHGGIESLATGVATMKTKDVCTFLSFSKNRNEALNAALRFNDGSTHAEVLALMDERIAQREEKL